MIYQKSLLSLVKVMNIRFGQILSYNFNSTPYILR